ncbi:MAG: Hpt domain-containing protein, partial [Woeseiaceae bacterium]
METVKAGRSEPWYMLDNAEACLSVLRDLEQRLEKEDTAEVPIAHTMKIATADTEQAAVQQQAAVERTQGTAVMPMAVISQDAEHLDPELLELFIEEAKEEIASIKRNLPKWQEAPDDMETLITVRRSFHTLKGSGRMVGAERIGEYCWSVESLLNKLINRTLTRTPPMVDFIAEAAAAVPELVEQLEVGSEPGSDLALLMTRANAFAEGDPNAAVMMPAVPAAEAQEEEAEGLEMDPVLLDIFSKETEGHLKVIREYLDACEGHRPPFHVTDKLHRACHTLHGSANMANVDRGVAVAGALNRFVRRVYDYKVGFQQSGLDAVRAATKAIDTIVGDINQTDRNRSDFAVLIEHLNNLSNAIEPATVADIPEEETVAKPEPAAAERPVEAEYDAEIAAIFSEEAAELLEAADQALADWYKEKGNRQHVEELKRHLHTLKGGARMAGIAAMGNLSHELETLLIGLDDGRIGPSPKIDELLQHSVDELHRMRDSVIAGKRVGAAAELEKQIHQINAGEAVPAAAIEAPAAELEETLTEDSVSVEFTIEPEETVSMVIVDTPLNEEIAEIKVPEEAPEAPPPAAKKKKAKKKPAKKKKVATAPAAPLEPAEMEEPASADVRPIPAQAAEGRQEFARIDAELLEDLLNAAGEISIYHSRLSQQVSSIEFHVDEFEQTVSRLREQLRKLEIETEAQIMHSHQDTLVARDFDPLEMDRYSNIQQLSRALAESANDMGSLKDLLQSLTSEAESLLAQQSRVTAELQDGLMRTRMVPFERHVPRLTRLVRQAASECGKRAELAVEGAAGELDRQVLEKMLPPFEHMMRNAVVHGIETPEERQDKGKPATGRITIRLHREGAEMVIDVAD